MLVWLIQNVIQNVIQKTLRSSSFGPSVCNGSDSSRGRNLSDSSCCPALCRACACVNVLREPPHLSPRSTIYLEYHRSVISLLHNPVYRIGRFIRPDWATNEGVGSTSSCASFQTSFTTPLPVSAAITTSEKYACGLVDVPLYVLQSCQDS